VAETPNTNAHALATDDTDGASRSPFRRFPYIQLVFCIACLTMTAWTWMRYSYCYSYSVGGLVRILQTSSDEWPQGRYARLGRCDTSNFWQNPCQRAAGCWLSATGDGKPSGSAHGRPLTVKQMVSERQFRGRLFFIGSWRRDDTGKVVPASFDIRLDASRFHPASIAGIVVGLMGCFIFGLYLRAWLRERTRHEGRTPKCLVSNQNQ